jgi:hypothetical protein
MAITLRPEQARVLIEAIDSGLAKTADEALDQALDLQRRRLPAHRPEIESTPEEYAHVSADWKQGLDAWLDCFPKRPLLPDEAFRRETWYPDRW